MTAVAVFLKYPTPGKVKTRLAATLGAGEAATYYSKMVHWVWENALKDLPSHRFTIYFFCDPYQSLTDYKTLYQMPGTYCLQEGSDLGARLQNCVSSLFKAHDAVIVIGTDCIEIDSFLIEEAHNELHQGRELVLGPAHDGGYYLIGLTQQCPGLFSGMAWSTSTVFQETVKRAEIAGLKYHFLKTLSDIDTEDDLKTSPLGCN